MVDTLRTVAVMLLQHAERGVTGEMPQWLIDCRRDIEAVEVDMQGAWKPIGTVPKDDSQFDVCGRDYGEWQRAVGVKWCRIRGCFVEWGLGSFEQMRWIPIGFEPTHWMRVEFPIGSQNVIT